ncbi:MAG TPA: lamin tail domain-containing protein [Anaerolineaceae bacterium]
MKRRSHLLVYLLLNVVISAATILVVLVIWDHNRPGGVATLPPLPTGAANPPLVTATPVLPTPLPAPTETLPPAGTPLIEIASVVGAGDVTQEVVMLRRQGDGNLRMAGWKLQGQHGIAFVVPATPELILYKGGAVQLFTRAGTDTATEIYWNRDQPAWRSGETLTLLDPLGQQRATFSVP